MWPLIIVFNTQRLPTQREPLHIGATGVQGPFGAQPTVSRILFTFGCA